MNLVATPTFSRKRKKLLSDAEFDLFKTDVSSNPERGNVIDIILLLDIYAKSDKTDLSEAEKKKLARLKDDLLENLK
jgi:hypothetical protein